VGLLRRYVDHVARLEHDDLLELVAPADLECPGEQVDGALAARVVVGPRAGARRDAEDAHVEVGGSRGRLGDLGATHDAARGVAILI
jgi:hypothetical protein